MAEPQAVAAGDRLRPLDGLRGIAILLVLWFHIWELTWQRADVTLFGATYNFNWLAETGFLGVDLFFFISGFCLFYPYAHALYDGRRVQTVREFAFRRAIKILPSYVLVIVALIAFGVADFPGTTFGDDAKQVVLHLLFIHTWFTDSYGSINGVLWSLGIEVEFYVVFPAFCWLVMRNAFVGFGAMLAIGVGSRAWLYAYDQYDLVHGITQLPAVLDTFGAGMLCAYLYRYLATRAPNIAKRRAMWTAVSLGGFALAATLIHGLYDARIYNNWYENWFVSNRTTLELAMIAVTLGALFAFRAWQIVLGNPLFVYFSLISYNLYLWHAALIHALLDHHLPAWTGAIARRDPHWVVPYEVLAWSVSVAFASIITFAFERPILRWRPKTRARAVRRAAET